MNTRTVLLIPGTTQIAVEYFDSLRLLSGVDLHGAGFDVDHNFTSVYHSFHLLPAFSDPDFKSRLEELCTRISFDVIIPCHDNAVLFFSEYKELFPQSIAPNFDVGQICRSKNLTHLALESKVNMPQRYRTLGELKLAEFPIFIRPDKGQGSRGAKIIYHLSELENLLDTDEILNDDWISTSLLPGHEITVDCFSNVEFETIFFAPRLRKRVLDGISVETELLPKENLEPVVRQIQNTLQLSGAWFFQMKIDKRGSYALMEVSNRVAGASGIHRTYGINLGQMNFFQISGFRVENSIVPELVRLNKPNRTHKGVVTFMKRDFKSIYVDFDDTLCLKGNELNIDLVEFLVKAKSQKRKIVLISKHQGNLKSRIEYFNLGYIFDLVIHLDEDDEKHRYLDIYDDSLFVDDSFYERSRVYSAFAGKVVSVDPSAFFFEWML